MTRSVRWRPSGIVSPGAPHEHGGLERGRIGGCPVEPFELEGVRHTVRPCPGPDSRGSAYPAGEGPAERLRRVGPSSGPGKPNQPLAAHSDMRCGTDNRSPDKSAARPAGARSERAGLRRSAHCDRKSRHRTIRRVLVLDSPRGGRSPTRWNLRSRLGHVHALRTSIRCSAATGLLAGQALGTNQRRTVGRHSRADHASDKGSRRPLRACRSLRPRRSSRTSGSLRPGRSRRPWRPWRPLRPSLAPRDRRLARVATVGRRIDEPQLTVL